MRYLAFAGLFFLALAGSVNAQQIAVRSGEHEGFSRLVFMYPRGTNWALQPTAGGYRLATGTAQFQYDLADVFKYIPKTRISAVHPGMDRLSLVIETPADVHSEAFQLTNGAVVLDVIDGAEPPAGPEPSPVSAPSFRPPLNDAYLTLYWRTNEAPAPTQSATPAQGEPLPTVAPPNPRIAEAEAELIDQLGRAATQGLLTLELPARPTSAATTPEPPPIQAPPAQNDATIALTSETVIDRDMADRHLSAQLAANGHSCPSDLTFDLQAWRTDDDPGAQIGTARRNLLGEFDRPNPDSVVALTRTYLSLGFGLEAQALMAEFSLPPAERATLELIADVLENQPYPSPEIWQSMMACDSKVALWALLAQPGTIDKTSLNLGAILRAYSALPPHIRELLGPRLSARFIALDAPDLARTVRAALARAPVEHGAALELIEARIDLSAGAVESATKRLEPITRENTETGAEALVLNLETRLAAQEAIGEGDVQSAAALALQQSGTDLGAKLRRVEILGRASTGQFEPAFNALTQWKGSVDETILRQTTDDLFLLLAKVPDDRLFLTTYFQQKSNYAVTELAQPTQLALSDRLAQLGFARAATDALPAATRQTEQGRLTLARAALALGDGSAALAYLTHLTGDEAASLRGNALQLLERHRLAAIEYGAAGAPQQEADEAWRGGNLAVAAEHGSPAQQAFLKLFTPPPEEPQTTTEGQITQAQHLLKQSEAERNAFADLMESLKGKD